MVDQVRFGQASHTQGAQGQQTRQVAPKQSAEQPLIPKSAAASQQTDNVRVTALYVPAAASGKDTPETVDVRKAVANVGKQSSKEAAQSLKNPQLFDVLKQAPAQFPELQHA